MKNRTCVIAPLLGLVLALASGCIIVSDDSEVVSAGVFRTSWTVNSGNQPLSCEQAGADKTSFLFTASSSAQGFDELFDCFDFGGNTATLPLDDYTYVATLLACPDTRPGCPGGTNLSATDPLGDTFDTCHSIDAEICFVNLPTVDFFI